MSNLSYKDYEQQMNKYFNYSDGRSIKKKDMVGLFTLVNEMPSQLALEHFPELAKSTISMVTTYCNLSKDALAASEAQSSEMLALITETVQFLKDALNNGNHSDEVKIELIRTTKELIELAIEYEKSCQSNILKILDKAKVPVLFIALTLVSALGVKANVGIPVDRSASENSKVKK